MIKSIIKKFFSKKTNKSKSNTESNTESNKQFSNYDDVYENDPSAFTVSTEVEVKDKDDGKIYKGTFAPAFTRETFTLLLDNYEEKKFNKNDVKIKIIEKSNFKTGMRGGKTKRKRKRKSITKKNHKN